MAKYDFEKLRNDLSDYYGTATFGGFPAAMFDASRVENASDDELIREAENNGFDLQEYTEDDD